MFARVTTVLGTPERLTDAIRVIENDVIPTAKMLPGFRDGYWLADRKTGKVISITLFETQADLDASVEAARALRESAVDKIGAEVQNVEHYEVVAST